VKFRAYVIPGVFQTASLGFPSITGASVRIRKAEISGTTRTCLLSLPEERENRKRVDRVIKSARHPLLYIRKKPPIGAPEAI
jgi:hypothetical protein